MSFDDKLENIGELPQSVKARTDIQDKMFETLSNFLSTLIEQATNQSDLEFEIERELMNRLQDTQERVSTTHLIQLLKVLRDSNNVTASGILGVLKENTKVVVENNVNLPKETSVEKIDMSLSEVNEAKKLIEDLKSLIYTESSQEELEKE